LDKGKQKTKVQTLNLYDRSRNLESEAKNLGVKKMGFLSDSIKISIALAYAEANAAREGAVLDMEGFDGVIGIVHCAAIAGSAVGDIHFEQDNAVGMGGAADLEGTAIAIADDDDDQIFACDLYRPREQFVRAVVTKNGANNQAESAIYIQYKARKEPVVNTEADVLTLEQHASPDEGTK